MEHFKQKSIQNSSRKKALAGWFGHIESFTKFCAMNFDGKHGAKFHEDGYMPKHAPNAVKTGIKNGAKNHEALYKAKPTSRMNLALGEIQIRSDSHYMKDGES